MGIGSGGDYTVDIDVRRSHRAVNQLDSPGWTGWAEATVFSSFSTEQ